MRMEGEIEGRFLEKNILLEMGEEDLGLIEVLKMNGWWLKKISWLLSREVFFGLQVLLLKLP